MSSRAPRSARRIACAKPTRVKRPWGTTPSRRRPSRYAPPCSSGSISRRKPSSAPRSSAPPILPRRLAAAASLIAESIVCETPSISFSATLPVKPSVTATSAAPATRSSPSTLPTKRKPPMPALARWESSACTSSTSGLPRPASSPLDSRPTRGSATPRTVRDSAAPMNANCTMCSRRTTALAPTSRSVTGWLGTGSGSASAGL